jgi:single-stranded-DNA-specific exonuclease
VFHGEDLAVVGSPRTVGRGDKHLKFKVRQSDASSGEARDVIGFDLGDKLSVVQKSARTGTPLELLFQVDENTYRGRTSLQLKAKDVRLEEG